MDRLCDAIPPVPASTKDAIYWQRERDHFSDEDAVGEFLRKKPKGSPRLIAFRSGRRVRNWMENVLAAGNASGFVEALEATALAQLIFEVRWFIEKLRITGQQPDGETKADYNRIIGRA